MGQWSLKRDEMESARGGDNEDAEQEASMRAADASGAVSARPDHDALTRREYGLLAPEGSTVNTAATGPLGIGDNPKETTDTGSTKGTETGTG